MQQLVAPVLDSILDANYQQQFLLHFTVPWVNHCPCFQYRSSLVQEKEKKEVSSTSDFISGDITSFELSSQILSQLNNLFVKLL
jgi:hypothetical protein